MISTVLALLTFLPHPIPILQQDRPAPQAQAVGDLLTELHGLVKQHPGRLEIEEWGRSRKDRPLLVARVAFAGKVPAEQRPALLLVAGLDGRRLDDSRIAMEQLRRILAAKDDSQTAGRLARCTLYICPLANPDGLALGIAGNGAPQDDDHDGREGEDAPEDLDGDGRALWMRWKDPEGSWIEDPDHAGLMRKADPAKNERGIYRLEREGLDQDGDDRFNEDAQGGVRLTRNFAELYPEHEDGAGRYVLSEPSALALAQFVSKHPRLRFVLTYGNNDNLLAKPRKNSRKGRRAPDGYFDQDLWIYEQLGKLYRETCKREGNNVDEWPGRFHSWVYAHMGIPSLATSLTRWSDRPRKDDEAEKPPKEIEEQDEAHAGQAQAGSKPAEAAKKAPAKPAEDTDESRQRDWLKKRFGDRAFEAWKPKRLPDGKEVEIGGLDVSLLYRIPESERESLTASHLDFLLALCDRVPVVRLGQVTSKQLAPGVLQVEALVSNEGWLPPRIHIAGLLRRPALPRLEPVLVTGSGWQALLPAQEARAGSTALLSGPRIHLVSDLKGRGSHSKLRWTFRIGEEGPPTILLRQGDLVLGSTVIPTPKKGGGR